MRLGRADPGRSRPVEMSSYCRKTLSSLWGRVINKRFCVVKVDQLVPVGRDGSSGGYVMGNPGRYDVDTQPLVGRREDGDYS